MPEAKRSFEELKNAFMHAPLLRHYDPTLPICVEPDASSFALEAILTQCPLEETAQRHWHPVAFYSWKMIPAECNYETHNMELLAIVAVFKHWRHYLEGARHTITVLTDHANLTPFMNVKELT